MKKTASLQELISKLETLRGIRSIRSSVYFQFSVLTKDRQRTKAYPEADGLILIDRPSSIRVRADFPVVGSPVFDMVSDGTTFSVHFPTKNRYLVGLNKLSKPSKKREENVRPQHILEALVIDPPRDDEKFSHLENAIHGLRSYHIVVLVRGSDAGYKLSRKIWFDREDFSVARQQVYDDNADPVTDAWYREWTDTGSMPFPNLIEINRPKDEYELNVRFLRTRINVDIPRDGFVLNPPEGVEIEEIGLSDKEEKSED